MRYGMLSGASAWLREEQQLAGPPGRFLGLPVLRLGHRAALKAAREYLDRLDERIHPGLELAKSSKRRPRG